MVGPDCCRVRVPQRVDQRADEIEQAGLEQTNGTAHQQQDEEGPTGLAQEVDDERADVLRQVSLRACRKRVNPSLEGGEYPSHCLAFTGTPGAKSVVRQREGLVGRGPI
ncbi:MAG: hypothetical protein ACR2PA_16400 [Hyphomicrobiaceae bacterium]